MLDLLDLLLEGCLRLDLRILWHLQILRNLLELLLSVLLELLLVSQRVGLNLLQLLHQLLLVLGTGQRRVWELTLRRIQWLLLSSRRYQLLGVAWDDRRL